MTAAAGGAAGERAADGRYRSRAERWQGFANADDDRLTEHARRLRPHVVFWWGGRLEGGAYGAWCYLCDRHVATWSRRWPPTRLALRQVEAHRAAHVAQYRKGVE